MPVQVASCNYDLVGNMEREKIAKIHHDLHGSDSNASECNVSQLCALCKEYCKLEVDIAFAKDLIHQAEKRLEEAEEKQRLFRANLNDRRDPLASRLPAEIVAQIFKATLTRKLMPGLQDHVIDSPLFLGAVCQTWRQIAWSTPDLWDWIHIFFRIPENKYFRETLEEWMERSGTLPLTIQITYAQGYTHPVIEDSDDRFMPSVDLVVAISHRSIRWENFSFTGPSATTDIFMRTFKGTPNLQVLRINTTDGPYCHFSLQKSSRLHSLTIGGRPDPVAWGKMDFVWDNLAEIHLEDFTAGVCVRAIQQMPRLTQCVLFFNGSENRDLNDIPAAGRFIHSNLKRFQYITEMTGHMSRSLFDHFTFPSLTELRIICHGDPHAVIIDLNQNGGAFRPYFLWERSIKQFLVHSSSDLSSLELQLPFKLHSLVEVLATKAHLSTLVLTDISDDGIFDFRPFLVHLANTLPNSPDEDDSSESPKFLPSLQSLSISGRISNTTPQKSAFETVLDACGQRSDLGNLCRRPLREIVITPYILSALHPYEKELQRARTLDDAGITLRIINPVTQKDILEEALRITSDVDNTTALRLRDLFEDQELPDLISDDDS